jgi:hypothetical protein
MRIQNNGLTRDAHRPKRSLAEQPETVSAARLAAEAAFAMPLQMSAALAVPIHFVSVRRRLRQPPGLQPPAPAVVAEQPAAKTPRVFRLGDSQDKGLLEQSHDEAAEVPGRRRRPVNATKRPGPVLRLVASGQQGLTAVTGSAPAAQPSPCAQLDQLRLMLCDLEPTFADIRFAQAFQIASSLWGEAWS